MDKPKIYAPLSQLESSEGNKNLYINQQKQRIYIDELSLFQSIIHQLMIVPIQTVVCDYVLIKNEDCLSIRKMQSDDKNDIFSYMKSHPFLRNPLTYFHQYTKVHELKIDKIKKVLDLKTLNANFYEILNILMELIKNDFSLLHRDGRSTSLCLTSDIFSIIWSIFKDMLFLSNWL